MGVRPAAVADSFYPADATALRRAVADHLAGAAAADDRGEGVGRAPKALIAPHAGFPYSGPTAGVAFRRLQPAAGTIERVVVIGPPHYMPIGGMAVPSADAFATPLGEVAVDREAVTRLLDAGLVEVDDTVHRPEHSIETHLPFLQVVLGDGFQIVPIVVGKTSGHEVARALEAVWGGDETVVSVSSDLSHYLDYETARRIDAETCEMIEEGDADHLTTDRVCGAIPIRGLLELAARDDMRLETLDVRNSGDTAGPRDRVVGYGAWAAW